MPSSPRSRRSRSSSTPRSTRSAPGAVAVSILALIGLVWTVSQLYGALDVAFARIFSDMPERDIVRRTARGFLVVGILGAVIVGFVIAAALATVVDSATHIEIPFARSIAALAAGCRS